MNWPGGAFNPQLGYYFINVMDLGQMQGYRDPASGPLKDSIVGTNQLFGRAGTHIAPCTPPLAASLEITTQTCRCQQPPWGELVAVNVNTGDIAWKVPLGITETLPADKQKTGRHWVLAALSLRRAGWFLSAPWMTISFRAL